MGLSAFLLFLIQPMFAKMALPLLGGSPAVWNIAMVFFQGMLLLGYLYAHLSRRWLDGPKQRILHLAVLAIPIISLPIGLAEGWTPDVSNLAGLWLIAMMTASIGLPFFAISTTAPVLQAWFSDSDHPDAHNPYFLFAASNLGSILALFSYPFVIEPWLKMTEQSFLWTVLYIVLLIVIACCAWMVWRLPKREEVPSAKQGEAVDWKMRLKWLAIAFVPSALLLAVTQEVSTDVAAVPLLWTIPLALYLLTFAIAFARRPLIPHMVVRVVLPVVIIAMCLGLFWRLPAFTHAIPIFFGGFFVIALYFHGELNRARPPASALTDFYLFMSLGGVLGGAFTALLAPLIFDRILEFPILLVAAAFAHHNWLKRDCKISWLDLCLVALVIAAIFGPYIFDATKRIGEGYLTFQLLAVALLAASLRRFAFGVATAATVILLLNVQTEQTDIIHRDRSYFGVLTVEYVKNRKLNKLVHGTTMHGAQSVLPARYRTLTTYYHPKSPIIQVLRAYGDEKGWPHRAGIAGMGVGTMTCAIKPGQDWTIYEIDPRVVALAKDTRFFHYLDECFKDGRIVLGDARLSITAEKDKSFDLLILDAFSSDAIPVHMLTKEAMETYFEKLDKDGLLAVHISNWNFDLKPVLATAAKELGLTAAFHPHRSFRNRGEHLEQTSEWVVVGRSQVQLEKLASQGRWILLRARPSDKLWTDDYSSMARIILWEGRPPKPPWRL
jgi:hypothetical protein